MCQYYVFVLPSSQYLFNNRNVCISFVRFFFSWRSRRRSCSSTWISSRPLDDRSPAAGVLMQYFIFMTALFAFQTYFIGVCIGWGQVLYDAYGGWSSGNLLEPHLSDPAPTVSYTLICSCSTQWLVSGLVSNHNKPGLYTFISSFYFYVQTLPFLFHIHVQIALLS